MIAKIDVAETMKDQVKSKTTDELKEEFRQGLRPFIDGLKRLALFLAEIESRGDVVEGLADVLLTLLRPAADSELPPDAAVRFTEAPVEDRPDIPQSYEEWSQPMIAARLATPQDLADQIAIMITRHPEPQRVWSLVRQDVRMRRLPIQK